MAQGGFLYPLPRSCCPRARIQVFPSSDNVLAFWLAALTFLASFFNSPVIREHDHSKRLDVLMLCTTNFDFVGLFIMKSRRTSNLGMSSSCERSDNLLQVISVLKSKSNFVKTSEVRIARSRKSRTAVIRVISRNFA